MAGSPDDSDRVAMRAVAENGVDISLVHGTTWAELAGPAEEIVNEEEGAVPPLPATAAEAALPTLRKGMSAGDLRSYLKKYTSENGSLLFDDANFDQLEHYSMETLYDLSGSAGKWQNVVDRLFDGDVATAQIFQVKVRDAKRAEHEAARHAASKLSQAEQKKALLASKRLNDVKGAERVEEPAQARKNPTADMMAGGKDAGKVLQQTCAASHAISACSVLSADSHVPSGLA